MYTFTSQTVILDISLFIVLLRYTLYYQFVVCLDLKQNDYELNYCKVDTGRWKYI